MSRVLLRKIFSRNDFLKATRVERMYMHMLQPSFILSPEDAEHLDLLRAAYLIIVKGKSRAETARLIKALTGAAGTSEYRIMAEAQQLFGNFEEVDKRVQRGILRDKLMRLLEIAENEIEENAKRAQGEDPDEEGVSIIVNSDTDRPRKIIETLMKLDRLDLDDEEIPDTTIPELIITSNPKALNQHVEVEEAELEEYDDDET